nr:ribonuclease H-like domain, reverse transcriptase, RNA-dependent DNA polymerase [Tanacetum cinerariifolium]
MMQRVLNSNEEIFAELARMGYEKPSTKLTFYKAFFLSQWKFLIHTILQCMSAKRTSWNEFSSSMAYAVICLSSGRKFNFSNQWKFLINTILQSMSAKCTSWNEFSLAMASAVICLSTEPDTTISEDNVENQSIPSPTLPTLPPQQPQDIPSTSQAQSPPPQP